MFDETGGGKWRDGYSAAGFGVAPLITPDSVNHQSHLRDPYF
ncbi:MAG: hypothetical protein P4M05_32590 [Bradyrhizobium sp.]|nr:hypothetical protein [Bradyrhizobium sp.]